MIGGANRFPLQTPAQILPLLRTQLHRDGSNRCYPHGDSRALDPVSRPWGSCLSPRLVSAQQARQFQSWWAHHNVIQPVSRTIRGARNCLSDGWPGVCRQRLVWVSLSDPLTPFRIRIQENHQLRPLTIKKHGRRAKSIFWYGFDHLCHIVFNLEQKWMISGLFYNFCPVLKVATYLKIGWWMKCCREYTWEQELWMPGNLLHDANRENAISLKYNLLMLI